MIEFLNYVPVEGSIGEFVFDLAKTAVFCAVLGFIGCLILWTISTIKKIVED